MASEKQIRILSKMPEIVVATPGRLWELIEQVNSLTIVKTKILSQDDTHPMLT